MYFGNKGIYFKQKVFDRELTLYPYPSDLAPIPTLPKHQATIKQLPFGKISIYRCCVAPNTKQKDNEYITWNSKFTWQRIWVFSN